MEILQENKPDKVEEKKEVPLTRNQKRQIERINEEANLTHKRLVDQFWLFFMYNDPASEEVADKQEEVSAKWKLYCRNRRLNPEILDIVFKSCEEIKADFLSIKNGEVKPEPQQ